MRFWKTNMEAENRLNGSVLTQEQYSEDFFVVPSGHTVEQAYWQR